MTSGAICLIIFMKSFYQTFKKSRVLKCFLFFSYAVEMHVVGTRDLKKSSKLNTTIKLLHQPECVLC